MIAHLGLFIFVVISYETFKFFNLKNLLGKNFIIFKKILKLLQYKNVSDNWKEKALLNYSKFLFISSFKIIFIIGIIFSVAFIIYKIEKNFYFYILSFMGLFETTILFIIYFYLRKIINGKL